MLMIVTFALNAVFNLLISLLVARFLGPEDFGRYALAQSIGIVFNIIFIDWLRHSVTRFYKEGDENAPSIRATLDKTLAVFCLVIAIIAAVSLAAGINFGLGISLAIMAPLVGISNGLFDFSTALLRTGFKNKPYAKAIIIKNILSIILIVAGAALFNSAAMALAGLCLSIMAALLFVRQSLLAPKTEIKKANFDYLRNFAIYAAPIIVANAFIQAIPLFNRSLLLQTSGFDATGQYSLAYDLGIRIVSAIGSSVDILLFQLAIRANQELGFEAAKTQLSLNIAIIFAIMTPVCLGLWLALPSFAYLFVPDAFRVHFVSIFEASLPGFFCYSLLFFSLHQVLFVAGRTWPLLFTSFTAFALNIVVVLSLGAHDSVTIAWIQGLGMMAAFLVGCVFIQKMFPVAPSFRNIISVIVGAALMVGATGWVRLWQPGMVTLIVTALLGGSIYVFTLLAFNTAGCKTVLRARLKI